MRTASWGTSRSGLRSVWKTFPVRAWWTISTAPISTTRCPSAGLRPVVSVSSTISRMVVLTPQPGDRAQELRDLSVRLFEAPARVDDIMGLAALIRITHLARQYAVEFRCGH